MKDEIKKLKKENSELKLKVEELAKELEKYTAGSDVDVIERLVAKKYNIEVERLHTASQVHEVAMTRFIVISYMLANKTGRSSCARRYMRNGKPMNNGSLYYAQNHVKDTYYKKDVKAKHLWEIISEVDKLRPDFNLKKSIIKFLKIIEK